MTCLTNEAPTEPLIVPCTYITGGKISVDKSVVQFTGWHAIPGFDFEVEERRIVVRLAMPIAIAMQLMHDFMTMLNMQ